MMKLSEYANHDAVGLGTLVRTRQISAQELTEVAARACAAVNPQINAVIESWQPELDDVAPALTRGSPLAGVPFLIKDVGLTMAGRKLEFGSRLSAGFTPAADSILMQRFRRAGLVTFGRTTIPEFAWSGTTESALCGATCNPWNLQRGAGGSSGGAAAAVAAGIVPLVTDAAGSIRIPLGELRRIRPETFTGSGFERASAGRGHQRPCRSTRGKSLSAGQRRSA